MGMKEVGRRRDGRKTKEANRKEEEFVPSVG